MKLKKFRVFIFATIFIITITGIIVFSDNDPELQFRLQSVQLDESRKAPDVNCFIGHNGAVYDPQGRVLVNDKSTPSEGNPYFDFVTQGDKTASKLTLLAVGRCASPATDVLPLEVKTVDLTFQVYSKNIKNEKILTAEKKLTSLLPVEFKYNQEKLFGSVEFPLKDIEAKLQQGSYDSLQEVQMYGQITMRYQGYNFPEFVYVIEKGSVVSYYPLKIKATGTTDNPQIETPTQQQKNQQKNVDDVTKKDTISDFSSCIQSGDLKCLDNLVFAPIYIIIVVIITGVIVAGSRQQNVGRLTGIQYE